MTAVPSWFRWLIIVVATIIMCACRVPFQDTGEMNFPPLSADIEHMHSNSQSKLREQAGLPPAVRTTPRKDAIPASLANTAEKIAKPDHVTRSADTIARAGYVDDPQIQQAGVIAPVFPQNGIRSRSTTVRRNHPLYATSRPFWVRSRCSHRGPDAGDKPRRDCFGREHTII